jgi:nitrogen PTS system EIIA component
MNIASIFTQQFIIDQLEADTKEEALGKLASVFPLESVHRGLNGIVEILMEREKLGSTGIGDGIAIPHAKIPGLTDLLVSFGRSKKGIAFDALDGKPVHLVFLLMAPEDAAGQHLKALAKISRMLKDTAFRTRLMAALSQDDLYHVIVEKDEAS